MGEQAVRFVRSLARDLDPEVKGLTMSRWYQSLSIALQKHNAAIVRDSVTNLL